MRAASVLWLGLTLGWGATACRIERAPSGRPAGTRTAADSLVRMEEDSAAAEPVRRALRAWYDRYSRRNWTALTQSFWRGAVITTKWLPPGDAAPRLDIAAVDEFVRQARESAARLAVATREPVSMDVDAYGDVAEAWVVYRSRTGAPRAPVRIGYGVDAFHLVRSEGAWRIVSLASTVEDPERPLLGPAPRTPGAAGAGAPGASPR